MPDEPNDDILLDYIDVYHAAAIAQAISAWARLEYEIDELIWELARVEPDLGACLTAQFQTVNVRLNALLSLAHLQKISAARIAKLNKFRIWVSALADKRNRIVHDPWLYGHKTKKLYRLQKTARARLDFSYKLVTEDELKALEAEIDEATGHFRELRSEILAAFWSSP